MPILYTRGEYPADWPEIANATKAAAGRRCIRCNHPDERETGHVLTVHHFDGDKANCKWWNLLALCQRCHLTIQGRVNPETPYFLEHSPWIKPYVAGFYSKKYLKIEVSRKQLDDDPGLLEGLLQIERLA